MVEVVKGPVIGQAVVTGSKEKMQIVLIQSIRTDFRDWDKHGA